MPWRQPALGESAISLNKWEKTGRGVMGLRSCLVTYNFLTHRTRPDPMVATMQSCDDYVG